MKENDDSEFFCKKCSGAGWVLGYELDDADEDTLNDSMTKYTCDWCFGDGKMREEEK